MDTRNQRIVEAVPGIKVSVINHGYAGEVSTDLAESAIIITKPNGKESIEGIQFHHRKREGKRRKSNRDIALSIAKRIREREARMDVVRGQLLAQATEGESNV